MKCSLLRLLLVWGIAGLAFAGSASATELVLENGWTNAPFATSKAEAFSDDGIVYLKGAVAGGSTEHLFTLPPALRPATNVFVSVDLCDAAQGRLWIQANGEVRVQSPGPLSTAQCFTSLDGVRFAPSASGFTPLTLDYGWTGAPFSTSNPAVAMIDGIVHLKGALANGTNAAMFQLPIAMRPTTRAFVPVNLCGAAKGRLLIGIDGFVTVVVQSNFAEAQCFTSLDGVAFAPSTSGFAPLSLQNDWETSPFQTKDAAVSMIDGIVFFQGAISSGSSAVLFTLPAAMRPATNVFVPIDLCSVSKGRLNISSSGVVSVQSELGDLTDARCLTSLDGASFVAPPPSEFTHPNLLNGWSNYPGTQSPGFVLYDGIVHFKGALQAGSTATLFTLPVTLRPETDVYVSVDLCDATVGRLVILSSGVVGVGTTGPFSDAQCFTSLEGASFALSSSGFTSLTLQNGWSGGPFGTSPPAAARINGIVHLKGAIGSGASGYAFTLPPELRPATNVYLQIGLCNAKKGRLAIDPSGNVIVVEDGGLFTSAQCFTSLDGAKFAPSTAGFADQVLVNGWTDTPYATSHAAASILRNIVYLKGAISNGASSFAFTLPPILRPEAVVYVPIDLFGGTKGRLVILPTGEVSIESPGGLPLAQDFTSLDGASFAVPEPAVIPALLAGVLLLAGIRRSRVRRLRADSRAAEGDRA